MANNEGKTKFSEQIERIKTNVANTYAAAEQKGATMPTEKNSDNLADTIKSIADDVEKQNLEMLKTMDLVNKNLYGQYLLANDDEYEKVYTWFQFWANIIMYGEVKNV